MRQKRWRPRRKDFIDLTGQTIGRFKVLRYKGRKVWPSGGGNNLWEVKCDCGAKLIRITQRVLGTPTHKGCPLIPRLSTSGPEGVVRKWGRAYRARQKQAGRCYRCSEDAEPGRTRCKEHLKIAREDTARRKKAIGEGKK